jgi:hypothetical protein
MQSSCQQKTLDSLTGKKASRFTLCFAFEILPASGANERSNIARQIE